MTIKKVVGWFLFGLFAAMGVCASGFMAMQAAQELYQSAYNRVAEAFTRVEVQRVPVEAEKRGLHQIISDAAAKYKIPKMLIVAMIEQESGKGFRTDRVRFEPEVYKRVKKAGWMTEEEARLQASSIGSLQVIPFFHNSNPECQVSIAELFDPEININCGASILRECLDYHAKITDKYARFKKALVCYNGGESYPDEVIGRIARLTIDGVL